MLAIAMAVVYGILHDQLTYTISPEYYTTFKFEQFGLTDYVGALSPRTLVVYVGIAATWWVGLWTGLALAVTGIWYQHKEKIMPVAKRALVIVLGAAALGAVIGAVCGLVVAAGTFTTVGYMHSFGYLAAAFGLLGAIIYSVRMRNK